MDKQLFSIQTYLIIIVCLIYNSMYSNELTNGNHFPSFQLEYEDTCNYHIGFNFTIPTGLPFSNENRLNIVKGIVNNLNSNLEKDLKISSLDDIQASARYSSWYTRLRNVIPTPIINTANEINVGYGIHNADLIRVQNDNYSNTLIKQFKYIKENAVNNLDVLYVFASHDKFSNINELKNAYDELKNSNKVSKIFFIFFEGGSFRDISTNIIYSNNELLNILEVNSVEYVGNQNSFSSNYVIIPQSIVNESDFTTYFGSIFKMELNHIKAKCDDLISCDPKLSPSLILIKKAFIKFLNRIKNIEHIEDEQYVRELDELSNFLTIDNPSICYFFNELSLGLDRTEEVHIHMSLFEGSNNKDLDFYIIPDKEILDVNFYIENDSINWEIIYDDSSVSKLFKIEYLNFCDDLSDQNCTEKNPTSQIIKRLFINLVNHLKIMREVPNGYTCDELELLRPYIIYDGVVGIYNFDNSELFSRNDINYPNIYGNLYFDFRPNESNIRDISICVFDQSTSISDIDLSDYYLPEDAFTFNSQILDQSTWTGEGKQFIKGINFCELADVEPIKNSCIYLNANTEIIKEKFLLLLNTLYSIQDIYNGFTNEEFRNLAPYLSINSTGIYNYVQTNEYIKFSFNNSNSYNEYDVVVKLYEGQLPNNIFLNNYENVDDKFYFSSDYYGFKIVDKEQFIRFINFCSEKIYDEQISKSCTVNNELSIFVKSKFIALINHLKNFRSLPNGYICNELIQLSPYIYFNNNIGIYNFRYEISSNSNYDFLTFSFSENTIQNEIGLIIYRDATILDFDLSNYEDQYQNFTFISTNTQNIISNPKQIIYNINFCPKELIVPEIPNNCTFNNPNTVVVNNLLVDLLKYIKNQLNSGTSPINLNGTQPRELILLSPYITVNEPKIYNLTITRDSQNFVSSFKFSFTENGPFDVSIGGGYFFADFTDNLIFDYSSYVNASEGIVINNYVFNNETFVKEGFISGIEFCSDGIYCLKHIVVVVDESGSIDESEARKIRFQLTKFVEEQARFNDLYGTNTFISLIGLSDSDINTRIDHILNQRISSTNLSIFTQWINDYKNRRISPNSDYWRSGLELALEQNPNLVILITDGAQTNNINLLKATFNKFNNNQDDPSKPHLFIIGDEKGFYVNQNSGYEGNPNLGNMPTPLDQTVDYSLKKSLKYLFNYTSSDFPNNSKYDFNNDYYGLNDFLLLVDEPNYITNGVSRLYNCGDVIPLDVCNDCLSFKPIPGKDYIVSGWVKEEQLIQTKTFTNSSIVIEFKDFNEVLIPNSTLDISPTGDIIEGWQRIFKKFKIPQNTVFMEFSLVNKNIKLPVFFDDIRIHPADGSMKSFVYDPISQKLMSELDDNNYSTFYEYDAEGGLIRVKKETSRGVQTIQETRSSNITE